MNYEDFFRTSLETLQEEGSYRFFAQLSRKCGAFPKALIHRKEGVKEVTVWCSNDYLGLGQNPHILETMTEALQTYGAGSGGTRNISGTTSAHQELEEELADLHDKEGALVFTSGYVANDTVLGTLGQKLPNAVIFSDAYNHASMIQGIRHAKVEKYIFPHNDVKALEGLLKQVSPERPKIIAFESIYSMSGTLAPLEALCDLAEKYNAFTYLDEVHGVGLYGYKGGGRAQESNLSSRIDLIQGTLGKAVGLVGGYIAGSKALIDFVRSFSSGFIFTTSLPPVIMKGATKSLQIIKHGQFLRERHQSNVAYFKACLRKAGLPFWDTHSHIVPLMVGDPVKCKALTDYLLEVFNLYVQPINYPTVRKGTERMRLTPSAVHTREMIQECTEALHQGWRVFDLPFQDAKASQENVMLDGA